MFDDGDLETVYETGNARAAQERSLVLHAVGVPHALIDDGFGFRVVVAPSDATFAREQLALYVAENRGWPPRLPQAVRRSGGYLGLAGFVVVLLGFAWLQTHDAFGIDWLGAGRLDGARVGAGEWWRAVTALTLHLDVAHLVGNLVIGAAFGYFAGNLLGPGVGWSAILVAGALGNLINAWVQSPAHRAIGASTAIFAALGMISAYLWKERQVLGHRGAQLWAPVVAGAVLLTWFGTGGERTDIVAHLTGFAAGALAGLVFGGSLRARLPGMRGQLAAGIGGLALLAIAWVAAISSFR